MTDDGHDDMHIPHPLQEVVLTCILSSSLLKVKQSHMDIQILHREHNSLSIDTGYCLNTRLGCSYLDELILIG